MEDHRELNPVELIWAQVKIWVALHIINIEGCREECRNKARNARVAD